ncbi:MAG: hypothetical protein M3411_05185 [Chloroflexota bacterium]|nr:hypothetical protein [Chloroflexota bacterium]
MSEQRPTGHVEPSPEAEPLEPSGTASASAANAESAPPDISTWKQAEAGSPADRSDKGDDLAQRLKPAIAVAEKIAGTAVDLSAKGLTKLANILKERRQRRDRGEK